MIMKFYLVLLVQIEMKNVAFKHQLFYLNLCK